MPSSDGPSFSVKIADTDATIAACAAGDDDPPIVGRMSGDMPTYRGAAEAAVKVLDQMARSDMIDAERRVLVRVYDGTGTGHTTPWMSPTAAAASVRAVVAELDFQADLDRSTPVPG